MKQYDRNKPLFAIHIPKTAGTSFRAILKAWYRKKLLLHYRDAVSGSMHNVFQLYADYFDAGCCGKNIQMVVA